MPQIRSLSVAAILALTGCAPARRAPLVDDTRARIVHDQLRRGIDSLAIAADALVSAARDRRGDSTDVSGIRAAFARTRSTYKRVEFLLAYYMPTIAIELNGAPIAEVDTDEEPAVVEPARGMQVIEGLIVATGKPLDWPQIAGEADGVRESVTRAHAFAAAAIMRDEHVFDAMRIEVARVEVLGITGFDSPVRHASLEEAAMALDGVREGLAAYRADLGQRAPVVAERLMHLFAAALTRLRDGDFGSFDRLGFIAVVGNPLSRAIADARDALQVMTPREPRLWRASAATLFEPNAFDADALRPAWAPPSSPHRVALGRRLFFDPILSGGSIRSCASCHQPQRAYTELLATSAPLSRGQRLRNAPTLINASLQAAQFADSRVLLLEDQIAAVVENKAEMRGDLADAADRLRKDTSYARAFQLAFGDAGDSVYTGASIRTAVASYIRSLNRLDSRVDRALRGDTAALTAEERRGFNLFSGKAACATCHFLPLTIGTAPPSYLRAEQEVIGVPAEAVWAHARIDADSGRERVTRVDLHRFSFKTPTIRNVALTAPYMHNGVFRTLGDVVRFYDVGGGAGVGIHLRNQTLPFDRLGLTDQERAALVAFMSAFTDTARTTAVPSHVTQKRAASK